MNASLCKLRKFNINGYIHPAPNGEQYELAAGA
jgi:hypothetical protein